MTTITILRAYYGDCTTGRLRTSGGVKAAALQFRTQSSGSGALTVQWEMNENGDLESMRSANRVILRSPNNSRWALTVSDAGVLSVTAA